MSSYDPVHYSDKAHFHSPSDGYSDDPQDKGRHINGNGIYNDYTVELKPKEYRATLKFLCFECKNTRRVKFVMAGAFTVFCLAMVLIIVSAVAHHHQSTANTANVKKYGLFAYGPDSNGVISFDHMDHKTYMNYYNRLENALHDYSTVKQMADIENKYIKCNDNFTSIPAGKVCMQTPIEFGDKCQNIEMYGIVEERPCVLLVLKLEENVQPKPFDFKDGKNLDVYRVLGTNETFTKSVGVSCAGKTKADDDLIGKDKREGEPIDFNPRTGFPLYFFLSGRSEDYINPAVMVQFNTIPTNKDVTVKCTAWAENFNNGQPQNSPIYSTEFTFKLK